MRAIVGYQRRLALFESLQNGRVVARLGLFLSGLGNLHTLPDPAEVEQRERHHRAKEEPRVPALEERVDRRAEVPRTRAQRDARQILRARRSHEQRARRELTLGLQYVGTMMNELLGRADI